MKLRKPKDFHEFDDDQNRYREGFEKLILARFGFYTRMINNQLKIIGHKPIELHHLKPLLQNHFDQRSPTQNLQSDLGDITGTWEIDWWWIADHILHDYFEYQQVKGYMESHISKTTQDRWYKWVNENSPPKAREIYLSDPNDIASKPILFTIGELLKNGTCLYPPQSEIKAVIGAIDYGFQDLGDGEVHHMYDNTSLSHVSEYQEWDKDEKRFKVVARSERANIFSQYSETKYIDKNGLETDHLEEGVTMKISYKKGLKKALEEQQKKKNKKSFWKRWFG